MSLFSFKVNQAKQIVTTHKLKGKGSKEKTITVSLEIPQSIMIKEWPYCQEYLIKGKSS